VSEEKWRLTLEIEGPLANCGDCRFTTALSGKFSVEDGRLVWRGDAELQPRRGPDLQWCVESTETIRFEYVTVDGDELSDEDVAALRRSDTEAVEARQASYNPEPQPPHPEAGPRSEATTGAAPKESDPDWSPTLVPYPDNPQGPGLRQGWVAGPCTNPTDQAAANHSEQTKERTE
jgi:hypothetical protein